MLVRGGRRHQDPHYGAVSGLSGGICAGRRLDSTTEEEGDWPSTGGEGTDWTLPERELSFFRSAPQAARSFLFFGTGEEGNRLELGVNESKCE